MPWSLLHGSPYVCSFQVTEPVGDAKGGPCTFPLKGGTRGSSQTGDRRGMRGRDADGMGGNGPCNDCAVHSPALTRSGANIAADVSGPRLVKSELGLTHASLCCGGSMALRPTGVARPRPQAPSLWAAAAGAHARRGRPAASGQGMALPRLPTTLQTHRLSGDGRKAKGRDQLALKRSCFRDATVRDRGSLPRSPSVCGSDGPSKALVFLF